VGNGEVPIPTIVDKPEEIVKKLERLSAYHLLLDYNFDVDKQRQQINIQRKVSGARRV
jgi:hypothetical protein